jgi:HPt (histidine-containing phosphotransfer) domain-containing protein
MLDAIVESTPESEAPVLAEPPWVLTEVVEAANEPLALPEEPEVLDEQVKVIGPLRIAIPLFNIFLNEADEQSRRLVVELSEWGIEFDRRAVPESTIALAHSLAGNSATVGYAELSELASALEHALIRSRVIGHGSPGEPELFSDAAEDISRLLHQFAAGFLRSMTPGLLERLAEHERSLAEVVAGKGDQWREASEADEPTPSVFDTISLQGVATPLAPTFGALDVETAAPVACRRCRDTHRCLRRRRRHRCRRQHRRRVVPDLRGRG